MTDIATASMTGSTHMSDGPRGPKPTRVLSRHNIGIPPTVFVSRKENILPAIEQLCRLFNCQVGDLFEFVDDDRQVSA